MTNGDKVRSMGDEELGVWLASVRHRWFCLPGEDVPYKCKDIDSNCKKCWAAWAKEEVKE